LISPEKIDEWLHEVEERPASAELIIRYIANRLSELTSREEELAAENIELLSGRKVADYEQRIASLEYQLELLKRQLGGEVILPSEVPGTPSMPKTADLLVYDPLGRVLRLELDPLALDSGKTISHLPGEQIPAVALPRLLVTNATEELLFVFDSGRTVTHPLVQIPTSDQGGLNWEQAFLEEPRIKEELAAIQPIAKMPLFETCIQASRRGYVKKIKMAAFITHVAENYIGTGVKLPADKTCGVTFAGPDALYTMVSQEGYLFSMPVERLPSGIEEVIHLGITDHIVATFIVQSASSILFITQNGKAVHREASWLEPANSFKSKGQALLSRERREAGVRIVGAVPVEEGDWGVFLQEDGALSTYAVKDLLAAGSLASSPGLKPILSFATFHPPEAGVE
jgi:DNA gyrase/topoisomerase IV subunit A